MSLDFDWFENGVIAASCYPSQLMLKYYQQQGIQVIINCSNWVSEELDYILENFIYYDIPISNFSTPSEGQLREFLQLCDTHIERKQPIVVHCLAGCGRTGQLIVAWAIHTNKIPKDMDPVTWIRKIRQCSLDNEEQEDYARNLRTLLENFDLG